MGAKILERDKIRSRANLLAVALVCFTSCTNINQKITSFNSALDGGLPGVVDPVISQTTTHQMLNVNVGASSNQSSGSTQNLLDLTLAVNTTATGFLPLTQFCGVGANPCICELRWNQNNNLGSGPVSIARVKFLPATVVQSGTVRCEMEPSFWDEIDTGTVIQMKIIPDTAQGNATLLSVQPIGYKKGTAVTSSGDFFDSTLTPFRNIYRYSCFSRRTSAHEVVNQITQIASPTQTGGTQQTAVSADAVVGSQFCSDPSNASNCPTPRNGFSAQSYYRNLYVRTDRLGSINSQNGFYQCPQVKESLPYSAGETQPSSQENKYWPLDSTFSLATQHSSDWNVPVPAASVLYKPNDAYSSSNEGACINEPRDAAGLPTKRIRDSNVVIKCLGYAKTPLPSGQCGPPIVDNNGQVRYLTRLRRYRAIYPPMFKRDMKVEDSTGLVADEVYVADRLVTNNLGEFTGEMIYGPKPCHFAWFDHEGVVNRTSGVTTFQSRFAGGRPSYVGTNRYFRDLGPTSVAFNPLEDLAVNPDGLILPNRDLKPNEYFGSQPSGANYVSPPSCSATIPIAEYQMGSPNLVRLITLNQGRSTGLVSLGGRNVSLQEFHLRPVEPWVPEYFEDRSFQACVPASDPYTEPPLHFYSKIVDGQPYMAWCSKPYPTQNPYWTELNKKRALQASTALTSRLVGYPTGSQVPHYTSASSQSTADYFSLANNGPSCTGTKICTATSTSADLAGCTQFLGESVNRNTCDRTVRFDGAQDFRSFPLQAPAAEIRANLAVDSNLDRRYGCTYSVASPNRIGKIPSSGCCGVSGGVPILQSILPIGTERDAHLEPYRNASFPQTRFCGNPVQN